MDEQKKAALFELLGESEATALLSRADVTAKAADEAGVIRKEKGLGGRLVDWLFGQPELEAIKETDPTDEADELELDDEETDNEVAAEKKEAKPAKKADDDDMDDTPLTMGKARAMINAAIAAAKADWDKARTKETDTLATLATKEEVAQVAAAVTPVVTIQKETVERLGQVEKQVQTLTGENLPRGMAGFFRASVEGSAATEKAAEQAETLKARQKRDPLDVYLDERLGA